MHSIDNLQYSFVKNEISEDQITSTSNCVTTPFSVKDILNLNFEPQHPNMETLTYMNLNDSGNNPLPPAFEDWLYTAYPSWQSINPETTIQESSIEASTTNGYFPSGYYQNLEANQFSLGLHKSQENFQRNEEQSEMSGVSYSDYNSAIFSAGMTSSHVQQLSSLCPPYVEKLPMGQGKPESSRVVSCVTAKLKTDNIDTTSKFSKKNLAA